MLKPCKLSPYTNRFIQKITDPLSYKTLSRHHSENLIAGICILIFYTTHNVKSLSAKTHFSCLPPLASASPPLSYDATIHIWFRCLWLVLV